MGLWGFWGFFFLFLSFLFFQFFKSIYIPGSIYIYICTEYVVHAMGKVSRGREKEKKKNLIYIMYTSHDDKVRTRISAFFSSHPFFLDDNFYFYFILLLCPSIILSTYIRIHIHRSPGSLFQTYITGSMI